MIKLPEEELVLFNKKYTFFKNTIKMNRSDFIKKLIFNEDLKKLIDSRNNAKLIMGINKIGVNINQAVKKIDSYSYRFKEQLVKLENLTNEVYKLVGKIIT